MKKIFMFLYLLITINILGMEEIKVSYPKGRVDFSFYQNLEEDKYKGKYVDLFDFLNKDKKYKFKYQIEKKDEKNLADIQIRKLGNFDSNYSYIETAYAQRIYVIAKKGVDLKNIDEKENLRVGYFGKGIDVIIMSIVEVIMSIPGILIALGIIIILGTGFHSLIVAIFVIYIPRCVNVVRGLVKKEKNMEYVIAVKTYGVSDLRIIYRHILPNILKSVSVSFTTGFAGAILTEAGLGYLGLGIQPPYPTWGNMLNQSQSYFLSAPWFTIAPGLAIIFTIYQIKKLEKRGRKY